MEAKSQKPGTVEAYFKTLPKQAVAPMKAIRKTLKQHLPKEAAEVISYGIPAFKWSGTPLYYAGWTEHVSIYPIPKGDDALMKKLKPFIAGKGTLKFMLDEPLPLDLIVQIAEARVKQDRIAYEPKKTAAKSASKKSFVNSTTKASAGKTSIKSKARSAKSK